MVSKKRKRPENHEKGRGDFRKDFPEVTIEERISLSIVWVKRLREG